MNEVNNIPEGWREENLVNCLDSLIDYRGKTPENSETGIPTLSAKSVKMGYIDYSQVYYISKSTYDKFMVRGFPKIGDVLMTTEAPLGCVAKLNRDDVAVAQRLLTLRGKRNVLNNDYLRYYLTSRRGQYELQSRASGSTVEGIKRSEFIKVKILLPIYDEQLAISNIFTAFDDKIELLQAQNITLEETAQTIFKEWFGKYQIGDELPEGWKVGAIGDILEIKRGGSPRPIQDYLSDNGYRWLKISDATATACPFIFNIKEHIKPEGLKNTVLKKAGDIVLSNSATPGMPKILAVDTCVHDGWMHFPSSKVSNEYLYLLFISIRPNLVQQGSGSVFTNLKTDILREYAIVIPPKNLFDDFDKLIKPVFNKIFINASQIQTLIQTRDELLPKLMSGEIRVNEFDRQVLVGERERYNG